MSFFTTGRPSSTKSTCASSRVEATLKARPAAAWMRTSSSRMAEPNSALIEPMAAASTAMPACSIPASTGTSGRSISS